MSYTDLPLEISVMSRRISETCQCVHLFTMHDLNKPGRMGDLACLACDCTNYVSGHVVRVTTGIPSELVEMHEGLIALYSNLIKYYITCDLQVETAIIEMGTHEDDGQVYIWGEAVLADLDFTPIQSRSGFRMSGIEKPLLFSTSVSGQSNFNGWRLMDDSPAVEVEEVEEDDENREYLSD